MSDCLQVAAKPKEEKGDRNWREVVIEMGDQKQLSIPTSLNPRLLLQIPLPSIPIFPFTLNPYLPLATDPSSLIAT